MKNKINRKKIIRNTKKINTKKKFGQSRILFWFQQSPPAPFKKIK